MTYENSFRLTLEKNFYLNMKKVLFPLLVASVFAVSQTDLKAQCDPLTKTNPLGQDCDGIFRGVEMNGICIGTNRNAHITHRT